MSHKLKTWNGFVFNLLDRRKACHELKRRKYYVLLFVQTLKVPSHLLSSYINNHKTFSKVKTFSWQSLEPSKLKLKELLSVFCQLNEDFNTWRFENLLKLVNGFRSFQVYTSYHHTFQSFRTLLKEGIWLTDCIISIPTTEFSMTQSFDSGFFWPWPLSRSVFCVPKDSRDYLNSYKTKRRKYSHSSVVSWWKLSRIQVFLS